MADLDIPAFIAGLPELDDIAIEQEPGAKPGDTNWKAKSDNDYYRYVRDCRKEYESIQTMKAEIATLRALPPSGNQEVDDRIAYIIENLELDECRKCDLICQYKCECDKKEACKALNNAVMDCLGQEACDICCKYENL